jgi:hypothetical protein
LYSYVERVNLRTIGSLVGGGTLNYQTNATGAPTNLISSAGGYNFSYDTFSLIADSEKGVVSTRPSHT